VATDIDSLQIKIGAEAQKANNEIDKLINKLGVLSKSLGGVDTKGLQKLASGVNILSGAMQSFQGVKLSDFTRIAKGIQKFEAVNGSKLSQLSSTLTPLASGIATLSGLNFDNKGLVNFINSITRLSNSNVSGLNSVNFAQLGANINQLTSALNSSKTVASNTIQVVNAVSRLASAGANAQATSTALPLLGANLKRLINSLSKAGVVSENTIQFASALGVLASAGNRTAQTAANLDVLAEALKRFMQTMSTAPTVNANIIQMTQALGQLASNSNRVGGVTRGLTSSINNWGNSARKAAKHSFSLASAIGKIYAKFWVLFRALGVFRKAINISGALTEVQNVVSHSFGPSMDKVEQQAKNAIYTLGMSELSFKQYASTYQSMGLAMGITAKQVGDANNFLATSTNGYVQASDDMADMSLNLTKLTGDIASFYDKSQADVAQDLQAVYTGMVVPLRKYGLDLTQATLKQWAMNNGLDANIESMSQAEKTMLRYQYVMAQTTMAQGDFARTADTWNNQVRLLSENFKRLGAIWGNAGINMLKPLLQAFNKGLDAVINFSENIVNALGAIFGWKLEIQRGTLADDFENAATGADDLASGTGKAADNAKKLKQQLQGFDELNVLNTPNDNSGGSGSSGGSGNEYTGGSVGGMKFNVTETDGLYKSSIKNLEELGEYINSTLTKTLKNIDWDKVYQGGKDFGKGLADFLNGTISPELFGTLGKTIAGSLNTVLYSALSFGKNFDFKDFGLSIATGINNFFNTYDFKALGKTYNLWVKGLLDGLITAIGNIDGTRLGESIGEFLSELDIPDIASKLLTLAGKIISGLGEALLASFETAPLETAIVGLLGGLKLFGAGEALGGAISNGLGSGISISVPKIIATVALLSIIADKAETRTTDDPSTNFKNAGATVGAAYVGGKILGLSNQAALTAGLAAETAKLSGDIGLNLGEIFAMKSGDWELADIYADFKWSDLFDYSLKEYGEAISDYGKEFLEWAGFKDKSLSEEILPEELLTGTAALTKQSKKTVSTVQKVRNTLNLLGVDTQKLGAITTKNAIKIRLFGNAFETISDSIPEYSQVIKDGISNSFGNLKNTASNAISYISKKLNMDYPNALNASKIATENVLNSVSGAFNTLGNSISASLDKNNDTIESSFSRNSKEVISGTSTLMQSISSSLNLLNAAVGNNIANVGNTINRSFKSTINNVGESLSQLNTSTYNQLSRTNDITNNQMKILYSVGTSWSTDFRKSVDYQMSYIPDSVGTYLKDSEGKITSVSWVGAGKDLVAGLRDGVEKKWSSTEKTGLVGKIVSLASGLTAALKKAFGIHSPSKLWNEEIGQFLPPGIGVGMEKAMPKLLSDASVMATDLTSAFNTSLQFTDPLQDLSNMSSDIAASINTDVATNTSTVIDTGRMSTDIASGIVTGMSASQAEQNKLLREQNDLLRQLLQKDVGITSDDIYNSVVVKNRDVFMRTGLTPLTI